MSEADADGFVEIDVPSPIDEETPKVKKVEDDPQPNEGAGESDADEARQPDEGAAEPDDDERDRELRLERRRARRQKKETKKARSEAAMLADQVRTLMETVRGLSQGQQQVVEHTLDQTVREADGRIAAAEHAYLNAQMIADPRQRAQAALQADKALQDARFDKWQLETSIKSQRAQSQQPAPRQFTQEARDWAEDNGDWYGVNASDTSTAQAVATGLDAEYESKGMGHLKGGPSYLEDLDDRLSRIIPHRYAPEEAKKNNRPRQTVAGSSRPSPEGGKVRMNKGEYDRLMNNAKQAGLDVTKKTIRDQVVINWQQNQNQETR